MKKMNELEKDIDVRFLKACGEVFDNDMYVCVIHLLTHFISMMHHLGTSREDLLEVVTDSVNKFYDEFENEKKASH